VVIRDPLYVLVHLPKSAGTTLKKNLANSYTKEERLPVINNWDSTVEEREERHEFFRTMPQEQKDKLKFLFGMSVWYGLRDCFPNRDVRFITVMREPFERAVSHYRFNVMRNGQKRPMIVVWSDDIEDEMIGKNGDIIGFDDWLKKVIEYPNYIHRYLERLGFTSPEQFYFIGLVENSKNDFAYLYHLFGTRRFFADMNITDKKIQVVLTDEHKSLFYRNNVLDVSWYDQCKSKNEYFYGENSKVFRYIRRVLFRKRIRLFSRRILLWLIATFPFLTNVLRKTKWKNSD